MKILSRYVLREFCVPLVYCLVGFLSIYLLFELFGSFGRLMEAKPGFGVAATYLAGYLAPYFMWMAPACLMLATLYTMWNFCRHSELIAMRASGIGFLTIVKPLLLVAVLMAGLVSWVNESYVPQYGLWAQQFKRARFKAEGLQREQHLMFCSSNRTWKVEQVASPDAFMLRGVAVFEKGQRTIRSAQADYIDGMWYFSRPEVEYYTEDGNRRPSPVPELDRLALRPFPELAETPHDFLLQNMDWNTCSTKDRLEILAHEKDPDARRGKTYDLWFRLFAPLACIVITLFAIPAGIASGRQSVFKGILGALGMFFVFYGLTILCMICAKMGWLLPPLVAVLLPDVVFFALGCHLFWRQR